MGKIDALRITGRPGGIEDRRPRLFVELGKIVEGCRGGQHRLVLDVDLERRGRLGPILIDQDDLLDRLELVLHRFEQGEKIRVDDHDVIAGVVHRIEDLLRGQPPVLRVQNGPHHGNGEETLQEAVAVIVEHADGVALLDAEFLQAVGQTVNPLVELSIGQPDLVPIDDFLLGSVKQRRLQQMFDQQLVLVAFPPFVYLSCHKTRPPLD